MKPVSEYELFFYLILKGIDSNNYFILYEFT